MISFRGVSKVFAGRHHALDDVTFSIARGEFIYLTGASGAGKTTIIRHIMMAETPTDGEVTVVNTSSLRVRRREIPRLRRKLGVVFQDFRLLWDRSVFDNVAFVLRISGAGAGEVSRKVMGTLASVGLSHKGDELPTALSGGEKQRVAIARAIVNDPYLLLADEPTGNLDPATADEIFSIFERVNHGGTAVLVATHDVARARSGRHRLIHMERGKIALDTGAPAKGAPAAPKGEKAAAAPRVERRAKERPKIHLIPLDDEKPSGERAAPRPEDGLRGPFPPGRDPRV